MVRETGKPAHVPREFAIFDHAEASYNRRRRHTSTGNIAQVTFEHCHTCPASDSMIVSRNPVSTRAGSSTARPATNA